MTRVFVYSPDLSVFHGELICRTVRAWALNNPLDPLPSAVAYVSIADPALTTALLKFRNILYIHDGVLPDWAGQIGEPQGYSRSEVSISATAAEIILDDRCPINSQDSTAGAIFANLISEANAVWPTGITLGDVDENDMRMHFGKGSKSTLGCINLIQRKSGYEWGIEASLPEGQPPRLAAWFRKQTGTDYTGESPSIVLDERLNIELDPAQEIIVRGGRVKNDIRVYATSGSGGNSHTGRANDAASIDTYGLAQFATAETAESQGQADARAGAEVAARRAPADRIAITVNDPALFPYMRIGNIFPLEIYSTGFQDDRKGWRGNVRIIGMAYDDMINKVELTVGGVS